MLPIDNYPLPSWEGRDCFRETGCMKDKQVVDFLDCQIHRGFWAASVR